MQPVPHPCLVADIGGTNARFATVMAPGNPLSAMVTLPTGAHVDFALTIEEALETAGFARPRSMLLAVAGPVTGCKATLTNGITASGSLHLDGAALASTFSLDHGMLFNDFEALSLSLPGLDEASLLPLGPPLPARDGPMLVVGPGTGLGVAALLQDNGLYLPVPSEAGHMAFGPKTAEDFALWPYLMGGPVSFEDMLSGRGLVRLHAATAALMGGSGAISTARDVTTSALEHADPVSIAAVRHFLAILARFAGDMALAFCATGGVFIGGGIAPRLAKLIDPAVFRKKFEQEGPASSYLAPVGTQLITAGDAALHGLAHVAANPARFRLDYAQRSWNRQRG